LQASTDGICWITLSDHKDEAARDDNRSQTWNLSGNASDGYFNHFRLLGSEARLHSLAISGFELFGELQAADSRSDTVSFAPVLSDTAQPSAGIFTYLGRPPTLSPAVTADGKPARTKQIRSMMRDNRVDQSCRSDVTRFHLVLAECMLIRVIWLIVQVMGAVWRHSSWIRFGGAQYTSAIGLNQGFYEFNEAVPKWRRTVHGRRTGTPLVVIGPAAAQARTAEQARAQASLFFQAFLFNKMEVHR